MCRKRVRISTSCKLMNVVVRCVVTDLVYILPDEHVRRSYTHRYYIMYLSTYMNRQLIRTHRNPVTVYNIRIIPYGYTIGEVYSVFYNCRVHTHFAVV